MRTAFGQYLDDRSNPRGAVVRFGGEGEHTLAAQFRIRNPRFRLNDGLSRPSRQESNHAEHGGTARVPMHSH
jgi:hypothetical protein